MKIISEMDNKFLWSLKEINNNLIDCLHFYKMFIVFVLLYLAGCLELDAKNLLSDFQAQTIQN